mmetsp:Transcript_17043/g.41973  ORF Transcript_17043/g.41973 Transcript_17043/m.41973 type:complete len:99 (-) Transcript_17043:188-484(-)
MRTTGGLLEPTNFVNDLEPPALAIEPRLTEIKEAVLARGWRVCMMSGSGTSIFALGPPDGDAAAAGLEGWQDDLGSTCFMTTFVSRPEEDEKVWYGEA